MIDFQRRKLERDLIDSEDYNSRWNHDLLLRRIHESAAPVWRVGKHRQWSKSIYLDKSATDWEGFRGYSSISFNYGARRRSTSALSITSIGCTGVSRFEYSKNGNNFYYIRRSLSRLYFTGYGA